MTIAISIKINDGLVLASDSASTLLAATPDGQLQVFNVYNNADKVFNLQKGLPIGAITWGAGSIGQASTSTIMKDLRKIFTDGDEGKHPAWKLNKETYTVEAVANRVTVKLSSGAIISKQVNHHKGHPKNPMSDEDVEKKFRMLTKTKLTKSKADKALETLWNLENLTDVSKLFSALVVA